MIAMPLPQTQYRMLEMALAKLVAAYGALVEAATYAEIAEAKTVAWRIRRAVDELSSIVSEVSSLIAALSHAVRGDGGKGEG